VREEDSNSRSLHVLTRPTAELKSSGKLPDTYSVGAICNHNLGVFTVTKVAMENANAVPPAYSVLTDIGQTARGLASSSEARPSRTHGPTRKRFPPTKLSDPGLAAGDGVRALR
jgi:hypothetical protein